MTRDDAAGGGVPQAVPMALAALATELGVEAMDTIWVFPPIVRGRSERGLAAVSCFTDAEDRRRLFTLAYSAELTGKGVTFEPQVREEGSAPTERIPRIIDGVVLRSGIEPGDPREIAIGGETDAYERLLAEFDLPEASPT